MACLACCASLLLPAACPAACFPTAGLATKCGTANIGIVGTKTLLNPKGTSIKGYYTVTACCPTATGLKVCCVPQTEKKWSSSFYRGLTDCDNKQAVCDKCDQTYSGIQCGSAWGPADKTIPLPTTFPATCRCNT